MIPHSRPTLGVSDIEAVVAVLHSAQLVQGEQVDYFEKEFAAFIGVHSAAAVSSGTSALHLSLLALDIHAGDEVIIPSFVCSALFHAVRHVGAEPILADIDDRHFNISVESITKRVTSKTKALIIPHLFGQSADLDELTALGVPIVEDCAQSLGSCYHGKMTGTFGILSVFSFYATKLIACGEGGMVASDDVILINRIKSMRDYDEKDVDQLRYNFKMTDMQAALGRNQLQQLPKFIKKRIEIAGRYDRILQDLGYKIPHRIENRDHIFFRYIIRHENAESLIDKLNDMHITCRHPIYKPLHYYNKQHSLPVTESTWRETLSIPIYPSLGEEDFQAIMTAFKTLAAKGE